MKIELQLTFSEDFLAAYPAFRGELTAGDRETGETWYRVWQRAQQVMLRKVEETLQERASSERREGRTSEADAVWAAAASLKQKVLPR